MVSTARLSAIRFMTSCPVLWLSPGDFEGRSPGRSWLVRSNERLVTCPRYLRPPSGVGKDHLPVAHFAASGLDWKLPDSLEHDGRAFLIAIGEHLPGLRDL